MTLPSLVFFKTCTKCECTKPAMPEFFHAAQRYRFGVSAECKLCKNARSRGHAASNRVSDAARKKSWYEANRTRAAGTARQWADKHKGKIRAQRKQFYEDNRERLLVEAKVQRQKRRARLTAADSEPYTVTDIHTLLYEQDGKCFYCQALFLGKWHIEHMIPLSRGGADKLDNICLACPPCNMRKHTKTAEEFVEVLSYE